MATNANDMNIPGVDAAPQSETVNTPVADDPFEKHINIAIEAQDGPQTPAKDKNSETPSGDESNSKDENAAKPDAGKDSKGSGGDSAAQPNTDKEGKEAKGAGRTKDLTAPDGTVIAKGGAERRFYEQRETARQEANHFKTLATQRETELQQARTELQTMRETVQSVNGMEPQKLGVAVKIMTDLQSDPVGTVKKLVAELMANGHTIEGIGAGVDQLAMQRMIDMRLQNQQQENNQPDEAAILREVEQETNQFFSTYPDAKPHDALIARVMRDNPGMGLHDVYFQLKSQFADRGYDWSRTLEDNLKDASSQSNTAQPPSPPTAPLPNGRPVTPNAKPANETAIAHESTDMGDIVREAMRENGLNV